MTVVILARFFFVLNASQILWSLGLCLVSTSSTTSDKMMIHDYGRWNQVAAVYLMGWIPARVFMYFASSSVNVHQFYHSIFAPIFLTLLSIAAEKITTRNESIVSIHRVIIRRVSSTAKIFSLKNLLASLVFCYCRLLWKLKKAEGGGCGEAEEEFEL